MRYVALLLLAISGLASVPARAELARGAKAPDFTLDAALAGKEFRFSLAQALKKGPVVVYFYPKSFTSVCTEEAHLFAESMGKFHAMGASVIGISSDTIDTQKEFSTKECRDTFPVAADPGMKVIKAYKVAFGFAGVPLPYADRVSYVIAPDGTISSVVKSGEAAPHVDNSLAAVAALTHTATN